MSMHSYEVLGKIGEGAYGVVLKCRHKVTGDIVAIKKFKQKQDDDLVRKTSHREVRILNALRQNNIVHLKDVFRRKGRLYLVLEYMEKNLLEVIESNPNGLPADTVRVLIYQLVKAITWCHHNHIVHRDIKPENLLVNMSETHGMHSLKLCDFGFARVLPQVDAKGNAHDLTDYVATRWYRAPELLLGSKSYGTSVDLWAIGCIMGELVDGQPLFPGESEIDQLCIIQKAMGWMTDDQMEAFYHNPRFLGEKLRDTIVHRSFNVVHDTLDRRFQGKIQKCAISFMKSVLHMDPHRRSSGMECLHHPYFAPLRLREKDPLRPLFSTLMPARTGTGEDRGGGDRDRDGRGGGHDGSPSRLPSGMRGKANNHHPYGSQVSQSEAMLRSSSSQSFLPEAKHRNNQTRSPPQGDVNEAKEGRSKHKDRKRVRVRSQRSGASESQDWGYGNDVKSHFKRRPSQQRGTPAQFQQERDAPPSRGGMQGSHLAPSLFAPQLDLKRNRNQYGKHDAPPAKYSPQRNPSRHKHSKSRAGKPQRSSKPHKHKTQSKQHSKQRDKQQQRNHYLSIKHSAQGGSSAHRPSQLKSNAASSYSDPDFPQLGNILADLGLNSGDQNAGAGEMNFLTHRSAHSHMRDDAGVRNSSELHRPKLMSGQMTVTGTGRPHTSMGMNTGESDLSVRRRPVPNNLLARRKSKPGLGLDGLSMLRAGTVEPLSNRRVGLPDRPVTSHNMNRDSFSANARRRDSLPERFQGGHMMGTGTSSQDRARRPYGLSNLVMSKKPGGGRRRRH